jgi:Zn-dependent protease
VTTAANQAAQPSCAACGTELAPSFLACPQCHALVHGAQLRRLADEAKRATDAGDSLRALTLWREAQALLPEGTQQHTVISARVDDLSRRVSFAPSASDAPKKEGHRGAWTAVIAIGVLLLSKGKLLLLGLTKLGTLSSMLLFLGVYWGLYGWRFALGFVVCLYIHEMGHVAALARYGIKSSMPMFIPGLGAYVRLHQAPANVHEDARVGLAGPVWGTAAALAAWGVYLVTRAPIWSAIAYTAAWLNLFNLLPIWQLDGGRAFRALSRGQRWLALASIVAAYAWTRNGMLAIVGIGAVWAAFQASPEEGDWGALGLYYALIVVLSGLMQVTALR